MHHHYEPVPVPAPTTLLCISSSLSLSFVRTGLASNIVFPTHSPIHTQVNPQMQVATKDTPIHPVLGPVDQQQESGLTQQRNRQQQQQHPDKSKSQVKFIRPAQMSLFADITCYPPLGQVTYVRRIQKARSSEADDTVSEALMDLKRRSWFAQRSAVRSTS